MKTIRFFLVAGLITMAGLQVSAQRYRTAADTPKLNIEYVKLSNEVAELTAALAVATNNLPGYEKKASNAVDNATTSAEASSRQADKATGGSIKEAKQAKRDANKAYKKAKASKEADEDMKDQDKKIARLTEKLANKKQRLQELETLRDGFRNTQNMQHDNR